MSAAGCRLMKVADGVGVDNIVVHHFAVDVEVPAVDVEVAAGDVLEAVGVANSILAV